MTQTKISHMLVAAVACVFAVVLVVMTGCSSNGTSSSEKTPAQLNREYMSSINSISQEAADNLSNFSEAIGSGDIATARIAANNAITTLGKIQDVTAPDALKDVDADYKKGAQEMSEALSRYVDLYGKVYANSSSSSSSSSDQTTVDTSEVSKELAEIQALYDDGIKHLSDADQLVASMSAESESSSSQQNPLIGASSAASSASASSASSNASSTSSSSASSNASASSSSSSAA